MVVDESTENFDTRREAFRYVFKRKDRKVLLFKKTKVLAINISAGGLAFYTNRAFQKYDEDLIHINLKVPGFWEGAKISVKVRILGITKEQICHCIFEDCTIEQYELIHRYVLEMQKKDLRHP